MTSELEMLRFDRVRHIKAYVSENLFLKEHMHGSFELDLVLEGKAQFTCNGRTRQVVPGDLLLVNPYEVHSYSPQGKVPVLLLTLQIHKLFLRRYVETIPRLLFDAAQLSSLPQAQYQAIIKLLLQTYLAYASQHTPSQFEVIGNATLLLGKLYDTLPWHLESNPDSSGRELQRGRVQRLVRYIDENYRQKITLTMLAEMEGISATHLSHFFRKNFGIPFHEYLKNQRLEKALVLLQDDSLSMVDICMNCGFSDSRYLEAACRKAFDCSVAEYRENYKRWGEYDPEGENTFYRRLPRTDGLAQVKRLYGKKLPELFL